MANYDLGIFIGHGYSRDGSYDSGAVGHGYRENDIARELGNLTAKQVLTFTWLNNLIKIITLREIATVLKWY